MLTKAMEIHHVGKVYKLHVGSGRVNLHFGQNEFLCLWCHRKLSGGRFLIISILEMKLKFPIGEHLQLVPSRNWYKLGQHNPGCSNPEL